MAGKGAGGEPLMAVFVAVETCGRSACGPGQSAPSAERLRENCDPHTDDSRMERMALLLCRGGAV